MTSRASDAFVAAAATLAAVLGLSTLTGSARWMLPAAWVCVTVAVTGVVLRRLLSRGVLVVLGQAVLLGWTSVALFAGERLWWGLPGPNAMGRVAELVQDSADVMQKYAAPLPTTRGVEFVLVVAVAALALLVDYLAVTRSAPAAAGLPLLGAFLTAAANSGASLAPGYFLIAAAMWLLLVARQDGWAVRRWSTTAASPRTPTTTLDVERDALGSLGTLGRRLGAGALVAAVVVPALVPHLPTRYILDGLGRSDTAVGRTGRVGFSSTLDLTRSLRSGSLNPVLSYRTSSPSTPPPLRVVVTSSYAGGEWRTRPRTATRQQRLSAGSLISPSVPVADRTLSVTSNLLDPPNVAAPQPVVAADFGDTAWSADPRTNDLYVPSRPDAYSLTYREVDVLPTQLQQGIPGGSKGENDPEVWSSQALDQASAGLVVPLAQQVTAKAATPFDSAVAIQDWLRSGGGFTYSLQLAGPVTDANGTPVTDPIVHFLMTKQGYCVQFASAMVMMARAKGIPARMAIGFLPGTQENGLWTVRAADAHSWPELYFPGAGWLRFEPTPSVRTGSPPAYTLPVTTPAPGATSGQPLDPGSSAATAAPGPRDAGASPDLTAATPTSTSLADSARLWLQDGTHLVLLAVVLGLLGSLVLPVTARLVHRRRRLDAASQAELAEAQWQELLSRLGDLGLPPPPPGGTLREWRRHFAREAYLDPDADASMGHVVETLERTRYARPGSEPVALGEDVRRVTRAAAVSRSPRQRIKAFLLPRDGVRWWRRGAARVVGAPTRWVDIVVERLLRRR